MDRKKQQIIDLAHEFHFELLFHKPENFLLRFARDGKRVDVWYSRMTIGIMEPHLAARFKYDVTEAELVEIFANPSNA